MVILCFMYCDCEVWYWLGSKKDRQVSLSKSALFLCIYRCVCVYIVFSPIIDLLHHCVSSKCMKLGSSCPKYYLPTFVCSSSLYMVLLLLLLHLSKKLLVNLIINFHPVGMPAALCRCCVAKWCPVPEFHFTSSMCLSVL